MQFLSSDRIKPISTRVLALVGSLCLMATAAMAEAPSTQETSHPAELVPAAALQHTASVDVRHLVDFVLAVDGVAITDPFTMEVVGLDEEGHQHRRARMQIEAGGSLLLGSDSLRGFDRLILSADRPFEGLLESTDSDFRARIISSESGMARTASKFATLGNQCEGLWNLSCISPAGCTYVSGFQSGRVEPGGRVFWNLHTPDPNIAYQTSANGCSATWYQIQSNGCPRFVSNCLGQTYEITTDLPTQGPDLVIRNLTLSPSTVTAGGQVAVSYDVVNDGDEIVTDAYRERIMLRAPGQVPVELLTTLDHGQDLPPGGSYSVLASVTPPGNAGEYAIDVEADAAGAITEANENNNVSTTPLTITGGVPQQVTIEGLTYRPKPQLHWQFSMHECPLNQPCTRSLVVRNTGTGMAAIWVNDETENGTSLSHNCPSNLPAGGLCTITATHTLSTLREYGGHVRISAISSTGQTLYPICIANNNTLCR